MADFAPDLRHSDSLPWWCFYLQAALHFWPKTTGWDRVMDLAQQRSGKDLVLDKDTIIQIKARRELYDDFLIEVGHRFDDGRKRKGWVYDKGAGWLLYCFPDSGVAYKVDFTQLRSAWRTHHTEWIARQGYRESRNERGKYTTLNVSVAWTTLEAAGVTFEKWQRRLCSVCGGVVDGRVEICEVCYHGALGFKEGSA